jgi:hypothetical protein
VSTIADRLTDGIAATLERVAGTEDAGAGSRATNGRCVVLMPMSLDRVSFE